MVESPPEIHAHRHRVRRMLLLAAGTLIVLLIVAVVALQTPYAERMVLARATNWLASRGVDFTADSLNYRLVPLAIDARNLRVAVPTATANVSARVGEVHLTINTLGLLRGRYVR